MLIRFSACGWEESPRSMMLDFGIGETIAALGGGLGSLFGGGAAAETGAALGAGALESTAALGGEAALGTGLGEAALGGLGVGEAALSGLGAAEAGGSAATIGAGSSVADLAGVTGAGTGGLAPIAGGASPAAGGGAFEVAGLSGAGSPAASAGGSSLAQLTGTAAPAAGGSESTFGGLLGKAGSAITANPLQSAGIGLAGAGLGFNILNGSKDSAERKALGTSAAGLNAQGQTLMQFLQSGNLPPGLQMQVQKASDAAKARIVQNHAQNGMPTDPSQNSALAQELNNVDQQAMIETAKIGQQLLTTGINETGLADDLFAKLIGIDKAQAQSTGLAISNFAAALGGRPGGNSNQKFSLTPAA